MSMKIRVHNELCQGHARCAAVAAEIFQLDEAGYIQPRDIDVTPVQEANARRGARACPEKALVVQETVT